MVNQKWYVWKGSQWLLSLVLKTGVSSQKRIHPWLKRHLMDTIVDNEFQYQTSFNVYCIYQETLEQSSWSYMDRKHHNTTLMLKTGVSNRNCPYPHYSKGTLQKPLWMENSRWMKRIPVHALLGRKWKDQAKKVSIHNSNQLMETILDSELQYQL